MGTTIDDAINSRALVHLEYKYPDAKERAELFRIQNQIQKIDTPGTSYEPFAQKHQLSGRDIRQLVKLTKLLTLQRGKTVTQEDLEWALQWRQKSKAEERVSPGS
jgi:AAA+ superfamily predicted ATPase